MSDLLSLLNVGSASIAAQNSGIAVAGNNVANAATPGYSRQRVDLEAMIGTPLVGGVRAAGTQRLADAMLLGRIRTNSGSLAMSSSYANALSDMETRLAGSGATIDEQLSNLFTRLSQVAAMPTDTNLRDAAVKSAENLVTGIQRRAAEVESGQHEADVRIRDASVKATTLAQQLAKANQDVAKSGDPTLVDRRDELARQLSEIVGGAARVDPDGQMRFVLDGGAVLVDGQRAASLTATTDPATGFAKLEVVDGASRRDVTGEIAGGSIGGDMAVRDRTLARVATQLDQLAYDLTTSFNAVHVANAGLDGVAGRNMFTPLGTVAGAAKAMRVDSALSADSRLLATSTLGSGPGDNRGALALFGLSTATVASGGTRTPTDAALDIVAQLALETSDAKADVDRSTTLSTHLEGLRDSISGVDMQEELTNLARFQHTSTALAKFVSTVDEMLGALISQL